MESTSTTTGTVLTDIERELSDGTIQSGVRTTVTTTTTHNLGDRVVDVSLAPFARQRTVIATLRNMRPSTDYLHVYFNGDNALDLLDSEIFFRNYINERGEPIGLTENWDQWKGSTVVNAETNEVAQFVQTDANGFARFAIRIPANTHIGDSVVEAIYEGDTYAGVGGRDTRANAKYRAHGLNQQTEPTILTTQNIDTRDTFEPPPPPEPPPQPPPPPPPPPTAPPPVCGQVLTSAELLEQYGGGAALRRDYSTPETIVTLRYRIHVRPIEYEIVCRPRSAGNIDPLAQSFTTYNEATYISSIDLWFQTKPTAGAAVTLQIREMVNGFPGSKIVPGSTLTLNPADVNISSDASALTRFKFQDPVYLEANTDYCFVILAFSTEYEMWTSELGELDITTGNRIDRQPVLGSLFTSQNNVTWTPQQNFDLKFRINSCNFSSDGVNEFINFRPMTGADAYQLIQRTSQLTLGSNQIIHPNTDIRWFYRFDRTTEGPTSVSQGITPEWRLFQPGVNLDLQNLTSQVLLRMEFSGGTLSPVVDIERAGIVFLKNLNQGNYITRTMEFGSINPENLRPDRVRGLFVYRAPTNTTIRIFFAINQDVSNESDINWREVATITGAGGQVESGETTFTVDPATDTLILDNEIGFFTGQSVTFSGVTGAPELTGIKYVRPLTSTNLRIYNSAADAENDTNSITISAGNGTIVRQSFARYNESVLPGGWTEAQFDYNFTGILGEQQSEGINQFKARIELEVDEGFEARTPLVRQLRMIAVRGLGST